MEEIWGVDNKRRKDKNRMKLGLEMVGWKWSRGWWKGSESQRQGVIEREKNERWNEEGSERTEGKSKERHEKQRRVEKQERRGRERQRKEGLLMRPLGFAFALAERSARPRRHSHSITRLLFQHRPQNPLGLQAAGALGPSSSPITGSVNIYLRLPSLCWLT